MHELAEAIVLAAFVSWPFLVAGAVAAVIVTALGPVRLARALGLDVQDGDR